ncbi:RluA family pseudouridine synthase [uncultured Treponema sp.]|uniref:RluA family pseudouridine synthase n=1 Tax=uncultured Treponema sp. TaxID=162155 RepID=UPI0028EE208F|nr:RluA family pseudouridine synthase [uncultured Treponema sp.]
MNKTVLHKPIAHNARVSFSYSGGNGGQREKENPSMTAGTRCKKKHKRDFEREKVTILYEDEYLAVIYKPDGMLSVPYPGSRAQTALEILERIMRKKGTYSQAHRPFAVHRLDRETSGVMMFAMTEKSQKKIMDNWQTLVTGRIYRAVAENPAKENYARSTLGVIKNSGTINDEIAYNAHNRGFVPHDKARFKTVSAITHYKIIERGVHHTLFELSLETGRKNQIRAHLASKGYVLAGDENYRAKTNPFGRLALHARTLEFNHPFTGEHLTFEIPEPEKWLLCVKSGDRRSTAKRPR